MFGQQRPQRNFNLLFRRGDFSEDRRLVQRHAHVQANQHQHGREDERNTPAPAHELFIGQQPGEEQEGAVREEEANRRAQLWERAIQGTLTRRGVLGRQQRRAAPFPAQPQALTKARQRQQHRRQNADSFIGRQQADGDGGDPHRQQRGNQRHFTADAIAKMPKDR